MDIEIGAILEAVIQLIIIPALCYAVKLLHNWVKSKNIDVLTKYMDMVMNSAVVIVKEQMQTLVDNVKGTDKWDLDFQQEILEDAKTKLKMSLSREALDALYVATEDLDSWLESVIEATVKDVKNGVK